MVAGPHRIPFGSSLAYGTVELGSEAEAVDDGVSEAPLAEKVETLLALEREEDMMLLASMLLAGLLSELEVGSRLLASTGMELPAGAVAPYFANRKAHKTSLRNPGPVIVGVKKKPQSCWI